MLKQRSPIPRLSPHLSPGGEPGNGTQSCSDTKHLVVYQTHYVINLHDTAHSLSGEIDGRTRHQYRLNHVFLKDIGDGTLDGRGHSVYTKDGGILATQIHNAMLITNSSR